MAPNPRRRDRANQKVGVEELQQQHGHQTTHGKNSSQRERESERERERASERGFVLSKKKKKKQGGLEQLPGSHRQDSESFLRF
jgi:hypothetical protein